MLTDVISQNVVLFLITCVGFGVGRLGYFDDQTTAKLNKLLLYVCVPCMTVSAAVGGSATLSRETAILALGASLALCLFLPLSGMLLNVVLRIPQEQRPMFRFMTLSSNFAFMGYPVVQAFFGTEAMFLNALGVMFLTVLQFSYGVSVLTQSDAKDRTFNWRSLVTPGLVASLVALLLFFAGVQLPAFLEGTLSSIGGIAPPLAMMLIGSSLVGANFKGLLGNMRLHAYALVKQLAIPLAVWFALRSVFPDPLVLGVTTVILAMPVGAMNIVFAGQYRPQDLPITAEAIIVTTLWSFAILPVLALVLI